MGGELINAEEANSSSKNLRQRVINEIEAGKSYRSLDLSFKIGKSIINRWCLRYQKEGKIEHYDFLGSKGRGKISNIELIEYIQNSLDNKLI